MRKIVFALALFSFLNCKENNTTISEESSQLYFNGDIITMEEDTPKYAKAIVTQNGKIVFVGSQSDATSKYKNSDKIDLKGKTLLPGFIDPHSHFGMVSNTMGQVDLNPEPVGKSKILRIFFKT